MYNEYTHCSETTAGDMLARPTAFGVAAERADGQDVEAVHEAALRAVERGRSGHGPTFLLCDTYRYRGHHVGDIAREYYRSKQEEQGWASDRDPIKIMTGWLLDNKVTDQAALDAINEELTVQMDAAVEFATQAPFPTTDEVEQDIYA